MNLSTLDVVIIVGYVLFALSVGSLFFKKASEGATGFFVGDRKLPWWIAGTSIVATTFAADTPLAVAGIVGNTGIAGNWVWWNWAIAHLVATFFFARLWRRAGVITDAEITELRYSGKAAAGLRGFKAVYFGFFVNCLTMAWVISAMVKISAAFFPTVEPWQVIAACIVTSVAYTSLGGFRGVVITDVVQFGLGMLGAIALAYFALDGYAGLGSTEAATAASTSGSTPTMVQALHDVTQSTGKELSHSLDFVPDAGHPISPFLFVVLLMAGWWRNAEGNGYLVQRLAATRDEGQAQAASLWFSIAHNALRPWPWIIVGLVALVAYPNLSARPATQLQGTLTMASSTFDVVVTPAAFDVRQPVTLALQGLPDGVACSVSLAGRTAAVRGGKAQLPSSSVAVYAPLQLSCGTGDDKGEATLPPLLIGKDKKTFPTSLSQGGLKVSPAVVDVAKGGTLQIEGTSGDCKASLHGQTVAIVDDKAAFQPFASTTLAPLTVTCDQNAMALGHVRVELTDREMGYPLMMKRSLPSGWLGLVIASLLAAFMSTIDTHTNWGASYVVQDLYRRFLKPDEDEAHYVMISRLSIVVMAVLAGVTSMFISSIAQVWMFLITLGAGLGSVSAARWYWHRVTPHAEFAAMGVTTLLAFAMEALTSTSLMGDAAFSIDKPTKILLVAAVSLATWIPVALFGPQNDDDTLRTFAQRVRPGGPGWRGFADSPDALSSSLGKLLLGGVSVFATLFGLGELLFGSTVTGAVMCGAAAGALALIIALSKEKNVDEPPAPTP
jgi:Na+/proline symporter